MKTLCTAIGLLLSLLLPAQNRLYVNAAAAGTNSGQSWSNAYSSLQAAFSTAQPGDEIWIAEGTYHPTDDNNRDTAFQLKSGVKLYGGFAGTETDPAQRNWLAHPTVLSGDIGTVGDSLDNSYTILSMVNPDSLTIVDGLVFRFGNAASSDPTDQSDSPRRSGGAMYIMAVNGEAYPVIRHCRFERNNALKFGGAVYINGMTSGSVAPMFLDCVFERNTAGLDGGAVYRQGSSWIERSPDFGGCSFLYNTSTRWAGALYYEDVEKTDVFQIWNTSFTGNKATTLGGAAYLSIGRESGSKIDVLNCDFSLNYGSLGSALCVSNLATFSNTQYIKITNCRFSKNMVGETGAVVYAESLGINTASIIKFDRDTFLENTQEGSANIISAEMSDFGAVSLNKCHFYDNNISYLLSLSSAAKLKIHNTSIIKNTYSFAILGIGKDKNVELANVILAKNTTSSGTAYPFLLNKATLNIKNCFIESPRLFYQYFAPGSPGQSSVNIANSLLAVDNFITYEANSVQTSTQIAYSLLGGTTLNCSNLPAGVSCGAGNLINLDPLLRDTASGDYTLLPCSPLIDAGTNTAVTGIPTDLAGAPRVLGVQVDIGVYEAPALALADAPQVQVACAGASNGSIAISPVFGCEPYSYNWSPPAGNGPQLNGLPPGAYRLTVTDAHGRQLLDTIQVAEAPLPILEPVATDVQCNTVTGGSISANANGGTPPYHYQWLPGAADTAYLSQLAAGSYSLTVVDAHGCQDAASATVALQGALVMQVAGQVISCHDDANGWFSATPLTGAAPFQWTWQGWSGMDSLAQPLGPGLYAVTVADAYGCTASFAFPALVNPDSLGLSVSSSPQTNPDIPNGQAMVTATTGGTPGYQYTWSTNASGTVLSGLPADDYTVTVTDQHGCTATAGVTIPLIVATSEAGDQTALIYPNPATDRLNVLLPAGTGARSIELCDETGRIVLRTPVSGQQITLDLQTLPTGAYTLRVFTDSSRAQRIFAAKILKQ